VCESERERVKEKERESVCVTHSVCRTVSYTVSYTVSLTVSTYRNSLLKGIKYSPDDGFSLHLSYLWVNDRQSDTSVLG
jgi:predicted ABC-type ATPase